MHGKLISKRPILLPVQRIVVIVEPAFQAGWAIFGALLANRQ
jgi:hypothetical protein